MKFWLWHCVPKLLLNTVSSSVTWLGDLWKFLATKNLAKVAQIVSDFSGYFETHRFYAKNTVATFWATFGHIWANFYFNILSHWVHNTWRTHDSHYNVKFEYLWNANRSKHKTLHFRTALSKNWKWFISIYFFKKWANTGLFFVYFRPFLITIWKIQIEKSAADVHGIQIRGRRMVGADETMEPIWSIFNCSHYSKTQFHDLF